MGMNECPWERSVSAAKAVKLKEIKYQGSMPFIQLFLTCTVDPFGLFAGPILASKLHV